MGKRSGAKWSGLRAGLYQCTVCRVTRKGRIQLGVEAARPGPRAEDEAIGEKGALGCGDGNAVAVGTPAFDGVVEAQVGAVLGGEIEMGGDARFGVEGARTRLPDRDVILGQRVAGGASAEGGGVQQFVREIMQARACQCPQDDVAVRRADHQTASLGEQRLARLRLQIGPEVVGALDEGHVAGVFHVGLTDDARAAMRGTEGVGRLETVKTQHATATFGEVIGGGAAHCAQAHDDDVSAIGHGDPSLRQRLD